ncbi:MAG: hypothetical protein RhofKO_10530 [Rhodothermales bacterium]
MGQMMLAFEIDWGGGASLTGALSVASDVSCGAAMTSRELGRRATIPLGY